MITINSENSDIWAKESFDLVKNNVYLEMEISSENNQETYEPTKEYLE